MLRNALLVHLFQISYKLLLFFNVIEEFFIATFLYPRIRQI